MHTICPRTTPARQFTAAALTGIALWLGLGSAAHGQAWTEDPVEGSCKSLVAYQSGTGVGLGAKHYPGKWGITEYSLFIGSKSVTDPDVMDEIAFSLSEARPATTGARARVCRQTTALTFAFRAETRIGAIEWKHGRKPDSACAKEWQRVRNIIRSHEPKHVQDINEVIAAANGRIAAHAPIAGCGDTPLAAAREIALKIQQLLKNEYAAIDREFRSKAQARDVEQAFIDCKRCDQGLSFKDVTLDCVMPMPHCRMRTGQKIAGRTCGDPTSANWTITPHYFAEGCGVSDTGTRGDKPFDNDCVEAGSDEEKRREAIYRQHRQLGAGGWMCVYSAEPVPRITIRNFRLSICQGPAEQRITVDAEPATDCDAEPARPAPRPSPPMTRS